MAICLIAETLPVLLKPEFGTLLPGPHWFHLLIHLIFEVSNHPAAFSGVSCTWTDFEQPSLNNIRDSTDSSLVIPCCYPGVLLLWWRGVGEGMRTPVFWDEISVLSEPVPLDALIYKGFSALFCFLSCLQLLPCSG